MFSSKSTHLISLVRKYRAIGKSYLLVNHITDTRYASSAVVSHDGIKETALCIDILSKLNGMDDYVNSEVIFIEEAQFFSDLFDFISRETDCTEKIFIVCGLSGGYKRQPLGDILRLIPLSERVEHLSGLCKQCKDGTLGNFTKRIAQLPEHITVGGAEMYECVCRKHYLADDTVS